MTAQQNFFAFIKDDSGSCQIKRIRVNNPLQSELIQIFEDQRVFFEQGVDTEVDFNGDWKPDANEVLTIDDISESTLMTNAINANASSFTDVNISNFSNEPIKAIFTGITTNGQTKVFVQKFSQCSNGFRSVRVLSRSNRRRLNSDIATCFIGNY
nr:hypothetical protein [Pseudoalteromonas spiralis]